MVLLQLLGKSIPHIDLIKYEEYETKISSLEKMNNQKMKEIDALKGQINHLETVVAGMNHAVDKEVALRDAQV